MACERCGGTGYAIRNIEEKSEVIRDRQGRRVMTWDLVGQSLEDVRRKVATGEYTIEEITTTRQEASTRYGCPDCDAGRARNHQQLANTPPIKPRRPREREEEAS